jgi:hypothetical protein
MCSLSGQELLALTAVSLSAVATVLWWQARPGPVRYIRRALTGSVGLALAALAGAALLIWAGIFLIYGFRVTGDGRVFYNQAHIALSGRLVSAETWSAHMPVYDYLNAVPIWIWNSLLAIPLFFTLCFVLDGLCLTLLLKRAGLDSREANALMMLGMLNGASWFLGIGFQQDEIVVVLFMLVAALLLATDRVFAGGIVLGAGCVATKLTFGLLLIAALAVSHRRLRLLAGVSAVAGPVMAAFMVAGFDPIKMVRANLSAFTPPSITTVFGGPWHAQIKAHIWVVHLITLAWCLAVPWMARSSRAGRFAVSRFIHLVVAVWLGYVLITPKSLTSYRLVVLPFVPFVLSQSRYPKAWIPVLFGVYTIALGSQYTLYEDLMTGSDSYVAFYHAHRGEPTCVAALSLVMLFDVIVIGCEVALIAASLMALRGDGRVGARHSAEAVPRSEHSNTRGEHGSRGSGPHQMSVLLPAP